MIIDVHVIGKSDFTNMVSSTIPKNQDIHFIPWDSMDEFLGMGERHLSTIAIFQINGEKFLIEQITDTLSHLKSHNKHVAVYIFSEEPSVEQGIRFIKQGADEYFSYPKDIFRLAVLISSKFEEWSDEEEDKTGFDQQSLGIIGKSAPIQNIFHQIKKISRFKDINVLITGETGTGKELVASAIHNTSYGRSSPFVEVNVSAIPDTLIESELFGHEKGSFTGAFTTKKGLFEIAAGGTLFLDEIGDLGSHLQNKLLRAIEQKTIHRVGGTDDISVSTRIIAATNRDLSESVNNGNFRQDLYYRLKVACIHLPPLHERGQDPIILAEHFLKEYCQRFNLNISGFTNGAKKLILEFSWPGNVRELKHVIERAVITAESDRIGRELLQNSLDRNIALENMEIHEYNGINLELPPQGASLIDIDNCAIRVTLKLVNGNKRKAARILGISPPRLYRKIEQMNMDKTIVGHA